MPKISILIFLLELESGLFLPDLQTSAGVFVGQSMESDITSLLFTVKDIYSESDKNGELTFNVLKSLLLLSSLFSLIIGTVVGLAQYKIKRLLAYSTIVRR